MSRIRITRTIQAPVEKVFDTIADIQNFSKAIPHIVDVEYLTESRTGTGTRFRETREMNGRREATELEVTEYVENSRIRLVADSHGTVWDTVFTVDRFDDGQTELKMLMEARAYKLWPKLMNPLMKFFIRKAIENDMDAVKSYCEK